ncbi:MAG: uroporphyrinogen-III C-methyltransferase [Gammaproteobacteria bacterium]
MNDPRADEDRDEQEPAASPAAEPARPTADGPAVEPEAAAAPGPETPAPAPQQASAGRSISIVLGFLALLIAFAAVGGAAFTWWKLSQQREAVTGQQAEASETLAEIRALVATTQDRLALQEERLIELNREAAERRSRLDALDAELRQARTRLEALAAEDAGPERSPSIAEIEFLLLLAGRELELAGNPRVALAALREADQRVARLDDPGLARVRAAINDEIAAVEAVADVDREGIAMRLSSLARRVEGLPLRASLAPEPLAGPAAGENDASGWDRLLSRLRAVGSGLFRIRRTDTPATPLLAPDESFFLYRNIELDLKSARLAALGRDPRNYLDSLQAARRALNEYFETSDDAVRSLLSAIEALEREQVAPAWPNISRSLALLRAAGAQD